MTRFRQAQMVAGSRKGRTDSCGSGGHLPASDRGVTQLRRSLLTHRRLSLIGLLCGEEQAESTGAVVSVTELRIAGAGMSRHSHHRRPPGAVPKIRAKVWYGMNAGSGSVRWPCTLEANRVGVVAT